MKIRAGYEISYECAQPTPMILTLSVHPSRRADLITPDWMRLHPKVPIREYSDVFSNICQVIRVPAGLMTIASDFVIDDSGRPDPIAPPAAQHALDALPVETLIYLLGSRYCETDRLSEFAWSTLRRRSARAGARAGDLRFRARPHHLRLRACARDADRLRRAHRSGSGVCRDFAHLAVTLCRCMNIPARYCTGYLGDIGVPPDPRPMDFSAWFEAYLGGRWYTFDARHNMPRIGRILIARGRDATDVAIVTSFGPHKLVAFNVVTDELKEEEMAFVRGGKVA